MKHSLIVLALVAGCAQAQTIGVHTVSHHFPSHDYQNNVNPGVYVRFDNGVTLGGYHNTLARNSFYVGYTTPPLGPFALTVGAISGYQKRTTVIVTPCTGPNPVPGGCFHHREDSEGSSRGAITLMLAPSAVLPEVFGITPRISVVPRFGAGSSTVVHLSLERGF